MMKHPALFFMFVIGYLVFGISLAPARPLAFSHLKHVGENGQECNVCHASVPASENLAESLGVSIASCRDCHDSLPDSARGFKLIDPSFRINTAYRDGFIKFSHKAHLKVACTSCHGDLMLDSTEQNDKPRMAACAQCHQHRGQPTLACLSCHDRKEAPADHRSAAWRRAESHGSESRFMEEECRMCHTDNSCLECHQGTTSRPIHDLNYRYTHGVDVKFKKSDCSVCHEIPRFCADCHEGKGRK
jgi:hypothetical protein